MSQPVARIELWRRSVVVHVDDVSEASRRTLERALASAAAVAATQTTMIGPVLMAGPPRFRGEAMLDGNARRIDIMREVAGAVTWSANYQIVWQRTAEVRAVPVS